jgi:hypothetical protein
MEKRKPYVKPVIASVNLIPDEAVLGNCKGTGGPTAYSGDVCTLGGTSCLAEGS